MSQENQAGNPGFLLTSVETVAGLAQSRSLWPVTMGLAMLRYRNDGHRRPAVSTWPASVGRCSVPRRVTLT